jgi:radical SAM superfamily enzyme YgiQ (UPF0313 family)
MLGLGYLASGVRHAIPNTPFEFRVVEENALQAAEQFNPQLVGISFVSQNTNLALLYAEEFGRRRIPVVMGGVHISVLPRCLPQGAMAACLGEGEQTFAELVKTAMGGKTDAQTLKTIPGIAYWEGNTLVQALPDRSRHPAVSRPQLVHDLHAHPHFHITRMSLSVHVLLLRTFLE